MRYSEALRLILWQGIEDTSGLWEVEWQLNAVHESGRGGINRLAAEGALCNLLDRGWIRLYTCREPDGGLVAVAPEEAVRLLHDESSWTPAGVGDLHVRFEATHEGRTGYEYLMGQLAEGTN